MIHPMISIIIAPSHQLMEITLNAFLYNYILLLVIIAGVCEGARGSIPGVQWGGQWSVRG